MAHLRSQVINENEKKKGLSYYHRSCAEPSKMVTFGQLLDEAAEKWPNKELVISHHEGKALTYQQAKEQAEKLGAGLLKLGLKSGDRLAIIGVNTVHWVVTMLTAAKTGIISVMLNPAYRAQEYAFCLKKIKVRGILTDHKFKTQNYPRILAEIIPDISSAPHGQPLSTAELPNLSFIIVATEEKLPGCYRLQDVMNLANNKETIRATELKIQPDDPICIMFSSGTTDLPKAAVLSHFALINIVFILERRIRVYEKALCLLVPFFHVFGVCVGITYALTSGNTLITPGPIFLKELTIQVIQRYKTSILLGTPTMLFDLYNELKNLLPKTPELKEACANIEVIGTGGSFISADLINSMEKIFPLADFIGALGMTEAGVTCFLMDRNDTKEKKETTIGSVVDHLEVKVVDNEGNMVPFGTPGEVWYRSNFNFLEYYGDEEKTKQIKTKSGWLKSGDIITLSEDGYATVKGRIKDMIIRGGENIFPTEIENFLNQHPEILQAEVYGVSDARLGEEVAASIILEKSSKMTEESLKEYCNRKIAHFKIPKYVRFVGEFPLTATRKVQKFALKKMHEKELQTSNI